MAAGAGAAVAGAGADVDAGKLVEAAAASAPLRSQGFGGETMAEDGYEGRGKGRDTTPHARGKWQDN